MLKTNLKQAESTRATSTPISHFLLGCSLLVMCTQTFASSKPKSEISDSVFAWGMWEYKIAPAAGDLQSLNASPLNPRSAKVTLRTNSNSAIAPGSTAGLAPNIRPVTQPAPIAPTAPIIVTQAPPPIVIPTIPAPPAATPNVPVTPQAAPNIGVGGSTPGGASVPGTGGFNFSF